MEFEGYYRERISNEIDFDALVKEIKDYGKTVLLCACAYAVKTPRGNRNIIATEAYSQISYLRPESSKKSFILELTLLILQF